MLLTPAQPPCAVSQSEVKTHLRVDTYEDDMLIDSLALAATAMAEHELGRALVTQSLTTTLDRFPLKAIGLARPPVRSVTSIKYIDESGIQQIVPAGDYKLVKDPLAPYVTSDIWPVGTDIEILFEAGFGAASDVPAQIKQWILVHIGAMYENRESVGKQLAPLPFVSSLLDRYRTW